MRKRIRETETGDASGAFEAPMGEPIKRELPEIFDENDPDSYKNIPYKDSPDVEYEIKTKDVDDVLPTGRASRDEMVRLIKSIQKDAPELMPFIRSAAKDYENEEGFIKVSEFFPVLIQYLDEMDVVVSPNFTIVSNPQLNESPEAFQHDVKFGEFKVAPDEQKIKTLLKDIKKYLPNGFEIVSHFKHKVMGIKARGYEPNWDVMVSYLTFKVKEAGMDVSPSWRVVPNAALNEITDSSVSAGASYETPKAWAKGKGKRSLKNSISKKFKAKGQLLGGKGAKFVHINPKCRKFPYCNQGDPSNISLSEDIYNKNQEMKFNKKQIDKIVENVIKEEVQKAINERPVPKKIVVTEEAFIKMVDRLVEEKSHPAVNLHKKAHKDSGAINKKSNTESNKKMKDSNKFEGNDNPEFPKAIGKGEKKARKNTSKQEEFIEVNRGKTTKDLKYDQEPSEEFKERAEKALTGDSKMGNAQKDVGNAIESETGKNMIKTAKKKKEIEEEMPMYDKDEQPVSNTEQESDEDKLRGSALNEDVETEINMMKKLFNYSSRTQS